MKFFLLPSLVLLFFPYLSLHAASLSLVRSSSTYAGTEAFDVILESDDTAINALSAKLVYQNDFFDLHHISNESGIVSMWVTPPHKSANFLFGSSNILFEGVIPGGFTGVRSPFYQGEKPGLIFHFELTPKKEGTTLLSLSDIVLYKNDGLGSQIYEKPKTLSLSVKVPNDRVTIPFLQKQQRIYSGTLTLNVLKEGVMTNDMWVAVFHEDESVFAVDHYEIAESLQRDPAIVPQSEYRTAENPYVLTHQERNYFTHLKAVYTNGAYAYATVPPVDSSEKKSSLLVILLLSMACLSVLSLYALRKKNFSNNRTS